MIRVRLLFTISLLLVMEGFSQTSLGPTGKTTAFYSFSEGILSSIENTEWDLAIEPNGDYAIRINEAKGVRAFVQRGPLNENCNFGTSCRGLQDHTPTALDTNGISSNANNWVELHNSYENLKLGALNQEPENNTDLTHYGWGGYKGFTSDPVHAILGYRIFAIQTPNQWFQFFIRKSLSTGFEYVIADLSGNAVQEGVIDRDVYSTKLFAYLNLRTNEVKNPEPELSAWDLILKKYPEDKAIGNNTNLPGVLMNPNASVLEKSTATDPCATPGLFDQYSTAANAIGTFWIDHFAAPHHVGTKNVDYYVKDAASTIHKLNIATFNTDNQTYIWSHIPYSTSALSSEATITPISCATCSDAAVQLNITGGSCPYTIAWDHGPTTPDLQNLSAGTYFATITDSDGSQVKDTIEITPFPCDILSTEVTTQPSCFGHSDGSIAVSPTSSNGTITINWESPNLNGFSLTDLSEGTYSYTLADEKMCQFNGQVELNEPALLDFVAQTTQIGCANCEDAEVALTPEGGTPSYAISWLHGPSNFNIENLASGMYGFTLTDAQGCSLTDSIHIAPFPCQINIDSITSVSPLCFGEKNGEISVHVSNPLSSSEVIWGGGISSHERFNLSAGVYSIQVIDSFACQLDSTIILTEPNPVGILASVVHEGCNNCVDGSISITPTGGTTPYSILINGNLTDGVVENLAPGSYNVVVSDANACSNSKTVIVNPAACDLVVDSTSTTNNLCYNGTDGSASVFATSTHEPLSFSWNSGSTDAEIHELEAGIYTCTVTDTLGCNVEETFLLTEPDSLTVAVLNTWNETCWECNDGKIELAVSGGTGPYSFDLNGMPLPATELMEELGPGNYNLIVIDNNNCTRDILFTILPFECNWDLELESAVRPTCYGATDGAILTQVVGEHDSISYQWNIGQTGSSIQGIPAGNYTCIASTQTGCTDTLITQLTQPDSLLLDATNTDCLCPTCPSGSVELEVTGGTPPYTFNWSNGDQDNKASSLLPGSYSVVVTDGNGCQKNAEYTVEVSNTSVSESDEAPSLQLYPNPVGSQLQINTTATNFQVTLYTANGQLLNSCSNCSNMDLSNYASGLFYLQLKTNKTSITKKIIKL